MQEQRPSKNTERSLKRKRELEDLAAAGDEWAKMRLAENESTRLRKQALQESIEAGDREAERLHEERKKKQNEHSAKNKKKRRERMRASHAKIVA